MATSLENVLGGGRRGERVHVHGGRCRRETHLRLSWRPRGISSKVWSIKKHWSRICRGPPSNYGDSRRILGGRSADEDGASRQSGDSYCCRLDRTASCQNHHRRRYSFPTILRSNLSSRDSASPAASKAIP